MSQAQGTFANLFIAIVAIWIAGFGASTIVGWGNWYASTTKRFLGKIWSKNKTRIIWMFAGGVLAFWIMSP